MAERDGAKWRDLPEAEWLPELRSFAVAAMMEAIKADLSLLGIKMDRFSLRAGAGRSRRRQARFGGA